MTAIKVCGITCIEDAELAVECGVDAIGVNLISVSKRLVDVETARQVARAVSGRLEVVGLVADLTASELADVRAATEVDLLQLHAMPTRAAGSHRNRGRAAGHCSNPGRRDGEDQALTVLGW